MSALDIAAPVKVSPAQKKHRKHRSWSPTETIAFGWLILLAISIPVVPFALGLDPLGFDSSARFAGLSTEHLLGTDNLGRDLLARALEGAKVSLLIGIGSTLTAVVIGVPIGILAGYFRGATDSAISFVVDVILGFPGLVLALVLASFLGASITNVMIAITLPTIPVFVRLARAQTLALMPREFIEASQVIGTPALSIVRRDIMPNLTEAIVAFALVNVGRAIIIEGGLSFLGLGIPLPQPSWGAMISEGRAYVTSNSLVILVPSVFLMLTILSLNLLSDRFLAEGDTAKGKI
ncbi:ABC transporter permease [Rhodococcus sp. OK302]|uniref:ABC transporter permease n=1 Tax=Rhodococcus sp. OK302 TaxID=1882769 RepID=UPI000B93C652|nr:ABC transporter permease [Rhodococcus sp. OK302]OYD61125.1 peptide/nickel transport system permease protein [Rhodococcus sp. OK302]